MVQLEKPSMAMESVVKRVSKQRYVGEQLWTVKLEVGKSEKRLISGKFDRVLALKRSL